MVGVIWNLYTTATEWREIMIKPELRLIRKIKWKHANELMGMIDQYKLCDNEEVALVEILDPSTKQQLEIQLMCTTCGRNLTLYGKN